MQGGGAGPSFLRLLEDLDNDGIVERHFGDTPEMFEGLYFPSRLPFDPKP